MEGGMIMIQEAWLFFLAILAGFALIVVSELASSFLTSGFLVGILVAIGAIAVIVFSLALLFLALKALLKKPRR